MAAAADTTEASPYKYFAFYSPKNEPNIIPNFREQLINKYGSFQGNSLNSRINNLVINFQKYFNVFKSFNERDDCECIVVCKMSDVNCMFNQHIDTMPDNLSILPNDLQVPLSEEERGELLQKWFKRTSADLNIIDKVHHKLLFSGNKSNFSEHSQVDANSNYIFAEYIIIPLEEIKNVYDIQIGVDINVQINRYRTDEVISDDIAAILKIYHTIIAAEFQREQHDFSTFSSLYLRKFLNLDNPEHFRNELENIWNKFKQFPNKEDIYRPFANFNELELNKLNYHMKFSPLFNLNFKYAVKRILYKTMKNFTELVPMDAAPIQAILQSNETIRTSIYESQNYIDENLQRLMRRLDSAKENAKKTKNERTARELIQVTEEFNNLMSKVQIVDESFKEHITFKTYLGYHLNYEKKKVNYFSALYYAGHILANYEHFKDEIQFKSYILINPYPIKDNLDIYIKNTFIERIVTNKIRIDLFCLSYLLNFVSSNKYPKTFEHNTYNFEYNKTNLLTTDKDKTRSLNKFLKSAFNIDLFDYQKSNVIWMADIEDMVDNNQLKVKSYVNNITPVIRCEALDMVKIYNGEIKQFLSRMNNTNPTLISRNCYFKHLNQAYIIDFKSDIDYVIDGSLVDTALSNDIHYRLVRDDEFIFDNNLIQGYLPIYEYWDKYSANVEFRGGVLADTVGLGKTASMIAHIAHSLDKDKDIYNNYRAEMKTFVKNVDRANPVFSDPLLSSGYEYNNLIIVPSRLTSQWEQEIAKYLEKKFKLRVKVLVSIANVKALEKELREHYDVLKNKKAAQEIRAKKTKKPTDVAEVAETVIPKKRGRKPKKVISEDMALLMATDISEDKLVINTADNDDENEKSTALKTKLKSKTSSAQKSTVNEYDNEQLYDVFIVSLNLMNNPNYLSHIGLCEGNHLISDEKYEEQFNKMWNSLTPAEINKYYENGDIKEHKEKIKMQYRYDAIKKHIEQDQSQICRDSDKFNIYKIKWNRVIIDEIHEKLQPPIKLIHNSNHSHLFKQDEQFLYECLVNIMGNYKWGLSGTPFESGCRNLAGILQFLSKKTTKINKTKQILKTRYLTNIIGIRQNDMNSLISTIVKQTTKNEVKDLIKIPIFTEDVIYVEQTNIERNIYNSIRASTHFNDLTKRKRLFLMCTNILINEGYDLSNTNEIDSENMLTLMELNMNMISKFRTQLRVVDGEVDRLESQVTQLTNFTDNLNIVLSNIDVKALVDELKEIAKEIDDRMKHYETRQNHRDLCHVFLSIIDEYELWSNIDNIGNIGVILLEDLELIKQLLTIDNQLYKSWETADALKYCATWGAKSGIYQSKIELDKNRRKLETNKNEQKRLNNQIALFKDNEFLKEKTADPCIICFEVLTEIAVTPCRHIFCKECCKRLSTDFKHAFSCPECRTIIQLKELNMTTIENINNPDKKKDIVFATEYSTDEEAEYAPPREGENVTAIMRKIGRTWKQRCTNKYGSKMAMLVEYLYTVFENEQNRVIIFSQYDKMLRMIGTTLTEFDIKYVYCTGNNFVVNKNINKFKKDASIRVIMLSSETSNSGSNLTEANHIIFIDVLFQNTESVQDIEAQAIGRAVRLGQKCPVKVVRFITKNTLEEEHFKKYRYDITKLQ